ncbi:MAG: transglycosylase domain-containing protein [Caulobacterales bacterium]
MRPVSSPPDDSQFARRQRPPPARKPRRLGRAMAIAAALLVVVVAGLGLTAAFVARRYLADTPQIPSREALWALRRSPGMTFLARDGQVIATRGAKYGQPVSLSTLPPYVPRAFLAAEDRRFYQHGPLDFRAILRALRRDVEANRSAEGASTLTQQLARELFLKRDRSLRRKVQEAYLAWKLEQAMSKNEILELYLNRTYFGAGAYGLDAAAQTYFGKPARQLDLAEAAILAGLPNAPSRLSLTNNMPGALARAQKILAAMRQEGWISAADQQAALASPPQLAPARNGEGDYSYILDQAAAEAAQLSGGTAPDLVVRTTIDPILQAAGVAAVKSVVEGEGHARNVSQGALVSLAPDGAILAMVGGLDHDRSAFNRVVQARRQPGSSFKAFVYGAAMEHGITPADYRQDAPIAMGDWSPENYGHGYAGRVTLQQALARSLNTVSVRLTLEIGPDTVAAFARRLGLSDIPPNPGPSIALGAYEVSPLEMAAGYQVFQTGGGRTAPYLVQEVRSTRGDVLYSHGASTPAPVYDPLYATRMVGMLKTVITAGTGTRANIGRPAAGKTGTSQSYRDAWFVGFTPDVLCAVWVGNDDGRPMAGVTGGELPAEIWRRFMTQAEKGLPPRDFPWLVAEPPLVAQADDNALGDAGAMTPQDGADMDTPPAEGVDADAPPPDQPGAGPPQAGPDDRRPAAGDREVRPRRRRSDDTAQPLRTGGVDEDLGPPPRTGDEDASRPPADEPPRYRY